MIVHISADDGFSTRLAAAARTNHDDVEIARHGDATWASTNVTEIARAIADDRPQVVIVGPDPFNTDGLALVRALDYAGLPAVIYCAPVGTSIIDAVRAGARDVIEESTSDEELAEVVERTIEAAKVRAGADPSALQSTISVLSPKGGVGTTTIATNLAVGLARTNPDDVVLVDLDVQFGDVSSAMGIQPEHTLADASRSWESLTSGSLKTYLTPHPTGLFVLAGAESLVNAEQIDPIAVKTILNLLTEAFPYVIIDTSSHVNDFTLNAFEMSTDLLLLSSTDVPGVRSLRRLLDAIDAIGMVDQRRHLVINRSTDRYGISIRDVEETAGMEAASEIPAAKEVAMSTNQGVPIMANGKRNPVLKALLPLVARFDNHGVIDDNSPGKRRRWMVG